MSFNLNKSEKPAESGIESTFDLSKNNTSQEEPRKKSLSLLITIMLLLLIGGAGYYFLNFKKATDSTSTITPEKETEAVEKNAIPLDTVTEKVSTENISENENPIKLSELENKIPASFEKGSSEIVAVDEVVIKQISDYLEANPSSSIIVNGYASSEGELSVNNKISQDRANALKKHLVEKGIAANRITAIGKGIKNPISTNDTEEGRQKNRRVEINL
ncbi:OmpA family protein [uncultured Flavobacterium sp.]|uniref:OmpA family protein n=1 Tax=uncultured Flavobacterium sp. TaxID=165435 RepID=UPI0025ECFF5E|nr:OmpA family protein [uncultured Flavobacterium sp.]